MPGTRTRLFHASSFYYRCYVYFERRHLQHIHLDYTHLDCKTTKCIDIRNCLARALLGLNWKRRLQTEHAQVHAHTHTHTCRSSPWSASTQRATPGDADLRLCIVESTTPPGTHTPAASLLAGCREVEFGNQRGRKRADAKRVKPLAAPEGGCLSAGLGERSEQGFSFLDGGFFVVVVGFFFFFFEGPRAGTYPTKKEWVPGPRRPRGRLCVCARACTDTHTPACTHLAPSGLPDRGGGSAQGRDPCLCPSAPFGPCN